MSDAKVLDMPGVAYPNLRVTFRPGGELIIETQGSIKEIVRRLPELRRALKGGWAHLSAHCPLCDHRWQAVHETMTDELECPECHAMVTCNRLGR